MFVTSSIPSRLINSRRSSSLKRQLRVCLDHPPFTSKLSLAELESKQATLVQVIESLGEYVKSDDATIRSRSTLYLSQVLAALPQHYLSKQQLVVILPFLCHCIGDGAAILGLCTLQKLPRFNDDFAIMTFRA